MSTRLANRVRFARALRSQPFAFLWAGQTISTLGDGAFTVALAWSIILLTGSATALAEVLIAQSRRAASSSSYWSAVSSPTGYRVVPSCSGPTAVAR